MRGSGKRRTENTRDIFSGELDVKSAQQIEEKKGSLAPSNEEDKLMRSVVQSDKKTIEEGNLITESLNQGIGVFNPDMMLEQMVKNYSLAQQLYGPKLLRLAFDYDPKYIGRNIRLPEFQKELKGIGRAKKEELHSQRLVAKSGTISDLGVKLSALVTLVEELEKLFSKGSLGLNKTKKEHPSGDKHDIREYRKGDRFRDINVRESLRRALRRGHRSLEIDDLKSHTRRKKSQINIVYAIDSSSSMKGEKLEVCKKAGMALTYQALQNRDRVGLIAFSSEILTEVKPTLDFWSLMHSIAQVSASKQTNIAKTIRKSLELFPQGNAGKHLVLITDAAPTVGDKPLADSLNAAGLARDNKVSVSVVGIKLDESGRKFSKKLTELGGGAFYAIRNLDEMDQIVLEDYYMFSKD